VAAWLVSGDRDQSSWFFIVSRAGHTIGHSAVPQSPFGPTVFADGLDWVRPTGFDVDKMLWARRSVQAAAQWTSANWRLLLTVDDRTPHDIWR